MSHQQMAADLAAVWPSNTLRSVVTAGYLTAVSVLSMLLAKRITSFQALKKSSTVKLLVVAVLFDSWLFVFASAILILGVGTSYSPLACALGIWWCIFLYATSKIFVYLFLMERIYIVHAVTIKKRFSRWQSPWYRASACFFVAWLGVAVVMIVGRIATIREDRACVIGLKIWATVPMLAVDAVVNIFLTGAFVWPIYRSKFSRARALARNSSIAALVALATSFTNIVILSIQHGHQLSWVCLGSCGLDVTINAIIIWLITVTGREDDFSSATAGTGQKRASAPPPTPGLTRRIDPSASGVMVYSEVHTQTDVNEDPEYFLKRERPHLSGVRPAPTPLTMLPALPGRHGDMSPASTSGSWLSSPNPPFSVSFGASDAEKDAIREEDETPEATSQNSEVDEKGIV